MHQQPAWMRIVPVANECLVNDGEQPTWDKPSCTSDSLFCAYFCLAMDILPGDGALGQQEVFPYLRPAFPWLCS